MKVAILAGALVIGVTAFAAHPFEKTVVRERLVEVPVRVEARAPEPVHPAPVQIQLSDEGAPKAPKVWPAPSKERQFIDAQTLAVMDRELDLAELQRRHVENALRDHEDAIEAYQREVRASGVFRPEEYSRSIREMEDRWYRQMTMFLDRAQNRRFLELVREGKVRDASAFEVDPEMIILK